MKTITVTEETDLNSLDGYDAVENCLTVRDCTVFIEKGVTLDVSTYGKGDQHHKGEGFLYHNGQGDQMHEGEGYQYHNGDGNQWHYGTGKQHHRRKFHQGDQKHSGKGDQHHKGDGKQNHLCEGCQHHSGKGKSLAPLWRKGRSAPLWRRVSCSRDGL